MKTTIQTTLMVLTLGISACMATAQETAPEHRGPHGPGGMRGQRPPPPPLMAALDANKDGTIDQTEIANASAALAALDKNGDGQLTREELRPQMPAGAPGPRGPRPGHRPPPGPHGPPESQPQE